MPKSAVSTPADITLRLVSVEELRRYWTGRAQAPAWSTRFPDGACVRCELGRGGEHRFTYGSCAEFLLSTDRGEVLCAPLGDLTDDWYRFLLDTVLHCVGVILGAEALHASAVLTPAGVVAIVGVSGGGKTTLAAELMQRGNPLFCDDVLALKRGGDEVLGYPGPPLMNLAQNSPVRAEALGRTLATFGDPAEDWLAVDNVTTSPAPVGAVFLLARREGLVSEAKLLSANPLQLLPHALGLPYLTERGAASFDLFSDLAAQAPIYRLEADTGVTPAALADIVESKLASSVGEESRAVAR